MKRLNLNTDTTLNSNSNTIASSQKAIKAYADTKLSKTDAQNTYLPLTGGTLSDSLSVYKNDGKITIYINSDGSPELLFNKPSQALRINQEGDSLIFFKYYTRKIRLSGNNGTVITDAKGTLLGEKDKSVANGVASLDENAKVPSSQIPVATASTFGGVKVEFDETTGTLNIKTE